MCSFSVDSQGIFYFINFFEQTTMQRTCCTFQLSEGVASLLVSLYSLGFGLKVIASVNQKEKKGGVDFECETTCLCFDEPCGKICCSMCRKCECIIVSARWFYSVGSYLILVGDHSSFLVFYNI